MNIIKLQVSLTQHTLLGEVVSNLWNGLMGWTDGMEYRLTKIAKTHHHGRGKVARFNWTVMSSLCFLALYPGPRVACSVRGQGYVLAVLTSGDVCVC